jgi:hypothetical protein
MDNANEFKSCGIIDIGVGKRGKQQCQEKHSFIPFKTKEARVPPPHHQGHFSHPPVSPASINNSHQMSTNRTTPIYHSLGLVMVQNGRSRGLVCFFFLFALLPRPHMHAHRLTWHRIKTHPSHMYT